ncbi:uncharacterized protein A1O9_09891 [Exophiala aquamarina CBS 119918]|uniref:Uncharacterized protein n=1 Tax=Exophiala aquamarina CBS 119918 TaxID=1182545 RepID=A0A072P2L4_9EURO|nr:uncharacterized protein A1O9_09891 [Exophiala aquamarina CBS 119918]KEF54096.1 hypothetical protein A1O9_09891 [Exophiala aquamarina CBS 119918]
MLALRRPQTQLDKCSVNILPCRIHHDGPTKITKRYWAPAAEKGVIIHSTEEHLTPQQPKTHSSPTYTAIDDDIEIEDGEDDDEPLEPVRILDELSSFDEVVVWGHDQIPASDDPFVRGVEEWIAFAEALHGGGVGGSRGQATLEAKGEKGDALNS